MYVPVLSLAYIYFAVLGKILPYHMSLYCTIYTYVCMYVCMYVYAVICAQFGQMVHLEFCIIRNCFCFIDRILLLSLKKN